MNGLRQPLVLTFIATLKVPKREIFVTELFILSDPNWVGDLRNESKNLLCKVLG
jgi:hypothetical protein